MQKIQIKKIILGAILAAISAAIRLSSDYLFPSGGSFGLPLYSIPLVISSLYLGPWFSLIVGFVADLGIGFLGPYGYKPLFVISSLAWSFIPGLIARKNYNFGKMAIAIIISYLFASLGNTFAIWVHFGKGTAVGSLIVRLVMLISLSPFLIYINHVIYERLLQAQGVNIAKTTEEIS
ncbi:MAG: ECF transporter S component [Acholeplasmataceae bacterium]|nr:ECF transporter S component [Acholeplasmataceae bacterium]